MTSYIQHSHQGRGKYFQIYVPAYDGGADSAFWRIGKNPTRGNPRTIGAAMMAEKFANFAQQGHTDHTRVGGQSNATQAFLDNVGWRDHTDGNRLTTTSGDKVEVIGGSYQMIICNHGDQVVIDASGGVLWDSDQTPSLVTKIDRDGKVLVDRTWFNGKTYSFSNGESWERHTGAKHMSIIGDPGWKMGGFEATPDITVPGSGNPIVHDGVWAADYTAVTWAANIKDFTKATASLESLSESDATLKDTVKAATLNEFITASATYNSTISGDGSGAPVPTINTNLYGGAFTDTTEVATYQESIKASGDFKSEIKAGSYSSFIHAATHKNTVVGLNFLDLSSTLTHQSFYLGSKLDVSAGLHSQINIGGYVELTAGRKCDVVAGNEIEMTFGRTFHVEGQADSVALTKSWKSLSIFIG